MLKEEKLINNKKQKVLNWIKNPSNLALISILFLAFAIRLYYFFITKNQPLWWDEAEYISTAKHWVFDIPYEINPQRPPLFQLLAAIFIYLNFSESLIKFIIVFLPSFGLVLITYLLGKELFSKNIGLFAALSSSFMWSYLFWTQRFQPDFFSMCFQLLAILFFWKLLKAPNLKFAIYTGMFTALSFYFKISALLIPLIFLLFILYKEGIKFIYKKEYWQVLLSFFITMIPFFIYQIILFGNPIAFAPSYTHGMTEDRPLGWMALSFFYSFPKTLFFILFLVAAFLSIIKILLILDVLFKDKEKKINPEIFSLLTLFITTLFYLFYIQGIIEDRWILIIVPFIFYFSSLSLVLIYENLKKFNKILAIVIIIIIFSFFIFTQLQHTTQLINLKKDTYSQVKDASIWIKENSEKGDSILSVSYTQTIIYSEMPVYTYSRMNEVNFTQLVLDKKPRYLIASIIEPNHPDWIIHTEQYKDGTWAIVLPYFNSTVKILNNNQVQTDLKERVVKPNFSFTLIYPSNEINGLFVYRIDYP